MNSNSKYLCSSRQTWTIHDNNCCWLLRFIL